MNLASLIVYFDNLARKVIRRLRLKIKRVLAYFFSRLIVTPYLGFIFSTHFLSDDIIEGDFSYLNKKSRNLRSEILEECGEKLVIFVQTNLLDEFVENYLNKICTEFILITGRDHWSKLRLDISMKRILQHPKLRVWYSQNLTISCLSIKHFPYGVNLYRAAKLFAIRNTSVKRHRSPKIHVPFCTVHEKNDPVWQPEIEAAMLERGRIEHLMASQKRYCDYAKDLLKNKFIISPAGDRPDTYRHWEIIYLGGIPISNLPRNFEELFGNSMCFVPNYQSIENLNLGGLTSDRQIASVKYWKRIVLGEGIK